MTDAPVNIKNDVRKFYDQVGWQLVGDDLYQNAHYEDLRPVSKEYIHRCHLRVQRHLLPAGGEHRAGKYLLDAGSGPIQYPEYLEYSRGYQYRVCADISIQALKEARQRIGSHGLYVVADVANLPFKPESFDGLVSLHTIHHLPEGEHLQAYQGLHRLLKPGSTGVVVNGWPASTLMEKFNPFIRLSLRIKSLAARLRRKPAGGKDQSDQQAPTRDIDRLENRLENRPRKGTSAEPADKSGTAPKGTFTSRHDAEWIKSEVGSRMPVEIRVWRSVSVRFLRNLIFPWLGGKYWLRLIYRLEERQPEYYGENGQYPLIILRK